jgi:hypothetical protein
MWEGAGAVLRGILGRWGGRKLYYRFAEDDTQSADNVIIDDDEVGPQPLPPRSTRFPASS